MKYIDPDGRHTWTKAESECDVHYNSLFDPALRNCSAAFYTDIEHYRLVRHSGTIDNHIYSISGTKDIIDIRQGDILLQSKTQVVLKRFNVELDGQSYDVFTMKGTSNTRLLFVTDSQVIDSVLISNDFNKDDLSIYNGFFNRDNIVDYIGKNDAMNLAIATGTFGLTFKMDPILGNFTEGLINYLASMNGGNIPQTIGIDKQIQDLINQIIAESD